MSNLIQELIQENLKEYKSDLFKLTLSYLQKNEQITDKDRQMLDRIQALFDKIEEVEENEFTVKTINEEQNTHNNRLVV